MVIFTHPEACWLSCPLVFIVLHWIIDVASRGGKDLKDSCCSFYLRDLTNNGLGVCLFICLFPFFRDLLQIDEEGTLCGWVSRMAVLAEGLIHPS
jgi:hypothetical protein